MAWTSSQRNAVKGNGSMTTQKGVTATQLKNASSSAIILLSQVTKNTCKCKALLADLWASWNVLCAFINMWMTDLFLIYPSCFSTSKNCYDDITFRSGTATASSNICAVFMLRQIFTYIRWELGLCAQASSARKQRTSSFHLLFGKASREDQQSPSDTTMLDVTVCNPADTDGFSQIFIDRQ